MSQPIVFLDTETLGLDLNDPIWEIGLIRREPDGAEVEHHFFVSHEIPATFGALLQSFIDDYKSRYDREQAWDRSELAAVLRYLLRGRPHVVGAVPNFDTERIAHQLTVTGWHYHLIDVENLAVGYLAAKGIRAELPWGSDWLSTRVGVRPSKFVRHTAMDDARWARAIYDEITAEHLTEAAHS